MSNEGKGGLQNSSSGGVSGTHPAAIAHEIFVGSATTDQRNLITTGVIPIACLRVDDVRFEFDSSFVRPEISDEIEHLADLREQHKIEINPTTGEVNQTTGVGTTGVIIFPPLSIFGHADSVNTDVYNKPLSGRRATAIYGLLTRDTDLWEELFHPHPASGDNWGVKSIQTMLTHLGISRGGASGKMDDKTREDVKNFQRAKGLTVDGDPGPKTREKLFVTYMDRLCTFDKDQPPLKLDKKDDFLARGADSKGKGDYQGCSEFNPILIFSQEKNVEFEQAQDKTIRNAANAPNRRVMVLLFRPGSHVLADKWPCPRAKEGVQGCIKRFFSDGEKRRNTRLPGQDRKFKETKDTFACRFYDRLSNASPCERELEFWVIRLLEAGQTPVSERRPLADLPFSVTGVGGEFAEFQGSTDADGVLRIPVRDNPAVMRLLIAGTELTILGGSLEDVKAADIGVFQRLSNLGFGRAELEKADPSALVEAMQKFQQLHGLQIETTPSADFRRQLRKLHGS